MDRDLTDKLTDIVGAAHVTRASRDLADAGERDRGRAWLVRPGSAAEVAHLVRLAGAERASIVPVGTASRRRPVAKVVDARPRIVCDLKRLSHVVYLDETSLVAQVQAGITGVALEELLHPRGLTLGDFPPPVLRSTLGGMLSVRTPGKSSPRHGILEDAVLGVSVVLADGRAIHTRVAPRRATGPDLARAFLGSEGALGILTGVVLRIHRRPEVRFLVAHRIPSVAAAAAAVVDALRRDARPAATRIYDAAEAAVHLGVDGLGPDEAILVAATHGAPELALTDRELLDDAAAARGGTSLGPSLAEIWWKRRHGHTVPGKVPPPPALEAWAVPSRLAAVRAAAVAAAAGAGRRARTHMSRLDLDGGCVFVTLLAADANGAPDPAGPARAPVEAAIVAAGGHLVGSRDDTLEPYLTALKQTLDPAGIFA
jgi:alkyldihydroxyacetonephosphate synthase